MAKPHTIRQLNPDILDSTPPPSFDRPPESFPADEYIRRIDRFRRELSRKGLDGAVVTRGVSRLYLTGFESSAGTLLVDAAEGAVFVTDFRYIIMAEKALPFAKCLLKKTGGADPVQAILKKWKACGYEALEAKTSVDALLAKLPSGVRAEPVDAALGELRSVKSRREIAALRRAVAQGDALYAWALPQLRPGMTEWAARAVFRRGADLFGHGESFDTIVCAGANGAECHHNPDLTVIDPRDPLLMDFGVLLDRYHSDMTRCVHFGKPSALYRKVYGIVLEANRKAIAAIRPGMTGEEVDAVARDHIAKAGYAKAFGHSLGHSVGMEIHEGPNFSPNEKRVIRPGMVVTVEPGIYLKGRLGVRIEDVVLVTKDGCEVLTTAPREL